MRGGAVGIYRRALINAQKQVHTYRPACTDTAEAQGYTVCIGNRLLLHVHIYRSVCTNTAGVLRVKKGIR